MEVSHNVIGVMQRTVETGIGELNARYTTNREQEDKANRPEHRRAEGQRAAPHGRDPREDLDARGNRDNHRCENEVALRVERQTDRVHMVSPDDEADNTNRDHSVSHAEITEDRLAREGRNDVADDTETRQDQNVHFWMTEEPEQMLVKDRITTAIRREEGRAKVTISQQHGDATCENRKRKQQQECSYQHSPGEQRHLVQRHARSTHVQDRRNEVDRTEDRRRSGNMERENREIDCRARLTARRKRRIQRPAAARPPAAGCRRHEQRDQQQCERRRKKPERNIVHTRERHIRRTDHQRDHPVGETTDQRRHNHEEDHDQSVRRSEHVEHMLTSIESCVALNTINHLCQTMENLDARLLKLGAHRNRQCAADDAGNDCEDQVQSTDVFMIGRVNPAHPAFRLVVVMGSMLVSCCASHGIRSRFSTVLRIEVFKDPPQPLYRLHRLQAQPEAPCLHPEHPRRLPSAMCCTALLRRHERRLA